MMTLICGDGAGKHEDREQVVPPVACHGQRPTRHRGAGAVLCDFHDRRRYRTMKRLIAKGLMFGNLIAVDSPAL
ncbi:MAG: hypothetical protein KDD95_02630, partial [Rhodobacteraceae bacterium]|nr:hypothetical protein [Paracoccaceae bacterium]